MTPEAEAAHPTCKRCGASLRQDRDGDWRATDGTYRCGNTLPNPRLNAGMEPMPPRHTPEAEAAHREPVLAVIDAAREWGTTRIWEPIRTPQERRLYEALDRLAKAGPEPIASRDGEVAAPEAVAQMFHEAYERLAPSFGYETREASAKPWADVPEPNRSLMVAVAGEVLARLAAPSAPQPKGTFQSETPSETPSAPSSGDLDAADTR